MKNPYLCRLACLLCLVAPASYAETELTIQGLEGDLKENVSVYLSSISEDQYSTSLRFQSRLEEDIRTSLKALGYYNPQIKFEVLGEDAAANAAYLEDEELDDANDGLNSDNTSDLNNELDNDNSSSAEESAALISNTEPEERIAENDEGDEESTEVIEKENELIVTIDAGVPTVIYESGIVITGEAATDRDFMRLIDESKLNLGQIVNHGYYSSFKSAISSLALKKGYFSGKFTKTTLGVSPERNQAIITLHYESGKRYIFGDTTIVGSQIEEKRVKSLIPFKEGDSYDSDLIGELSQNLSATEWFSTVSVAPEINDLETSTTLPTTVYLKPQTRNLMETGIGYSTDVGVRGKLSWKKPWLNEYGHSFNTDLTISAPEKTITASYKIPLEDILNDYYLIQYGYQDEDNRDTDSQEQTLSFARHWNLENGWHRNIYVRALYEDYEQASTIGSALFVLPGMTFSRTRSRGGTMPRWADKQSITVEGGSESLLSDTRIVRVLGHSGWIRSSGRNHRFLTRIDAGANFAEDFDKVPPSLRFFGGGINTIRGYGYESISPKDSSGELLGGKYAASTSLEYQYRMTGNWWLATFVDYGDAWTDTPDWRTGVGVGIRWGSPVGPIRLDFAYGNGGSDSDEEDFKVHFTIGPQL